MLPIEEGQLALLTGNISVQMSTLIRRRGEHSSQLAKLSDSSKSTFPTNKSKNLNWWRILMGPDSASNKSYEKVPVSQKACDQVRLDVERAFCFDSGMPSRKIFVLDFYN